MKLLKKLPEDNSNDFIHLSLRTLSDVFIFWGLFNKIANSLGLDDDIGILQENFADVISECVNWDYEQRKSNADYICSCLLNYYLSLLKHIPISFEFIDRLNFMRLYPNQYVSMDRFTLSIGMRIHKSEYNRLKLKKPKLVEILVEAFEVNNSETNHPTSVHLAYDTL